MPCLPDARSDSIAPSQGRNNRTPLIHADKRIHNMKTLTLRKALITSLAVALWTLGVHAQGTINLANSSTSLVRFNHEALVPEALRGQPAYTGSEGFYGPIWVALYFFSGNTWSQVGARTGIVAPGRYAGGLRGDPNATPGSGMFKIVAWCGEPATFEAAMASGNSYLFANESVSFTCNYGGGITPPGILPSWAGVTVGPLPEPSTMQLLLAGGATISFLRLSRPKRK